jgi:2,3,4,5-tetrahydropyridine-2,6-dicarboxylate N-succinyltransferase
MNDASLQKIIDGAWEGRDRLSPTTKGEIREAVEAALDALDAGSNRVAEKAGGVWRVNEWLKKAVLLSFRLNDFSVMPGSAGALAWDKIESKFKGWDAKRFAQAGFRAVPGAIVRRSAFIGKGAVLMPCFVNVGAYVGEGTMVDTWATVGSCAQVGRNCHISGGAGLGGVLEPVQATPVILEDNCFVGARAEVAEGVIVGEGSVLAMGVYLGASTKIIERASGSVHYGRVPPYSVVVPGSLPQAADQPALYCAVIVKHVDAKTRAKTSINELLRD